MSSGRAKLPPAVCGSCGKTFDTGGRRGADPLCQPCYFRAWRAARREPKPKRIGRNRAAADLALAAAEAVQTLREVGTQNGHAAARADALAEAIAKWAEVTGRDAR